MPLHFHRDLERVTRDIVEVGSLVETSVARAIDALQHRNADEARNVMALDRNIDRAEVELEELVLKVLALHQPVAHDLRFLIAVLKLNNDFERMGDLAGSIANRAMALASGPWYELDVDLVAMGLEVRSMVRGCLDALLERSATQARHVLAQDDHVDAMHLRNIEAMTLRLRRERDGEQGGLVHAKGDSGASVDVALSALTVSRCLERIADLATNVAEDVIFLVEGEVVRHRLAWAREDAEQVG